MSCPYNRTYKSGCRCTFCAGKHSAAQQRYRRRQAIRRYGITTEVDRIPAGPVIKRVTDARANGATFSELAQMTGLRKTYLQALTKSRPSRKQPVTVQRRTFEKIMKGIPEYDSRVFLPTTIVPRTKAIQICHSLSAQGWTMNHQRDIIENNTEHSGEFIKHIAEGRRTGILKKNEDLMLWLEKIIGDKTGPSKYASTYMTNRGYFPLRHYTPQGKLNKSTLTREQKAILERVQSKHG